MEYFFIDRAVLRRRTEMSTTIKNKCPFLHRKCLFLSLLMGCFVLFLFMASHSSLLKMSILRQVPEIVEGDEDPASRETWNLAVEHRRRLAATIDDVQREIHRLAGMKGTIDSKWSLKLAAVAQELDPRLSLIAKVQWDYSARLPDMDPQLPNKSRHVCPEVYYGPNYDLYNQLGMVSESCTYVPKFDNVLTVVLPAFQWIADEVVFVSSQIRKLYDVPIIAIVPSDMDIDEGTNNITIKRILNGSDEATFVNNLMKSIITPYVLFGKDFAHFSNQSSLERMVRVLDNLEHVKVVGGAARDLHGRWIHGCLQQRMANYQAHYSTGYYYSKYECMYCDDLLTPFVTSVQLIKETPFTKGLKGPALYRDWFANVRSEGHLTMVCPDVMFFVNNHTVMTRNDWLMVAKKWILERIHSYDNQLYNFSCDSVGISCGNPLGIIRQFLLPPCCLAKMEEYLSYLTSYGLEHNLPHELQAGSTMGAIKMGGYLPWDYDADIIFECKDFTAWLKADQVLKPKGCQPVVMQTNKYVTVYCPYFFLELYCHNYNTTSRMYLPEEYRSTPTTINYAGRDVIVSSNPGLHCRNRMGIDSLKHAAHWRTLQVTKVGKAKGGYENPGIWNQCKTAKHHSCLDIYPGDGNLPFLEPFLKL